MAQNKTGGSNFGRDRKKQDGGGGWLRKVDSRGREKKFSRLQAVDPIKEYSRMTIPSIQILTQVNTSPQILSFHKHGTGFQSEII